jgi:aspartate aminotransferase-like enzyme/N-acyl-L-homoserine lactone synthetase
MLHVGQYVFKQAESPHEFDQIHALNYRTFVDEIAQHADPGNGVLIDKFHAKNVYLIAVRLLDRSKGLKSETQGAGRVVGMLGVHDQPPFSVADRLQDPSLLTRRATRPLEARLLAIEPHERHSTLFLGLIWSLYDYAQRHAYTHLYISAFEQRLDMYQRLGFEALGPAVPCGKASFVPMMLSLDNLPERMLRVKEQWETHLDHVKGRGARGQGPGARGQRRAGKNDGQDDRETSPLPPRPSPLAPRPSANGRAREEICLLPGPVTVSRAVRDAFHEPPIYHRGSEFIDHFVQVRRTLSAMVGGRSVVILNGSGTLANETVAATLAATPAPSRGILLSNGEFGERLAQQATRFGLRPRVLSWDWGKPWDLDDVDAALAVEPAGTWVWGVHQESSTGVLNDLPGLVRVVKKHGGRVCLDCISSLGAVPLDLRDVYLATGATGKSLGAIAGAALVFADPEALARVQRERVPSYFDLVAALDSEGPCYTFPSATLRALEAALEEYATPDKARAAYARYADLGQYVRQELRRLGLEPLSEEAWACPVVTTFTPPGGDSAPAFVARCRRWGFAIGGQSGYLAKRRLVQIATMGAVTRDICAPLFERLEQWLSERLAPCTSASAGV